MKNFLKFLLIFVTILILSIFIFFRDKVSFFLTSAEIEVKTALGSEQALTIQIPPKATLKNNNSIEDEIYTIKSTEKNLIFSLTPTKNSIITLSLINPQKSEIIQFYSFLIGGRKAFTTPQKITSGNPYGYTFIAKKNKKYKIKIQWKSL